MLTIHTSAITDFAQNFRVVYDDETKIGFVVDPGGEVDRILEIVSALEVDLQAIYLTHAHIDHAGGVAQLEDRYLGTKHKSIKLFAHRLDQPVRSSINKQAMFYGLSPLEYQDCREPDSYVEDDQICTVGPISFTALFTPGHAPGHLSFYFGPQPVSIDGERFGSTPVLIAGDALFSGSIGRTDLPFGDHQQLVSAIQNKILTLPEATVVCPGHGPNTTVGVELRNNPFLS